MATEKDFVKRIVKEMVDYFLYHELYLMYHMKKQRLRVLRLIQNYLKT